jgi:flagellar hook protein FlgE
MLTSLYTAVSGMNANGTSLSVIADNIANLNTGAFKASRATFGDVLAGSVGELQIGRGVLVSSVSPLFTQGSFETTANPLDLGVEGDGFFIVNEGGAKYYTRAGNFSLDKDGNIVNPDGLVLQGYLADTAGNITGTIADLKIESRQSLARATTNTSVGVNLDSVSGAQVTPFTLDGNGDSTSDDPANFNFSHTVAVYDSQGGVHQVTVYFEKTADNAWTAHYVHQDTANPSLLVEAGAQSLTFDLNGALTNDTSGTAINFNFGTAVAAQAIFFNYGTGTGETPAGNGLDGTTQFAADFGVLNVSQDGYSAGNLKNVVISEDAIITGIFTNGQTRPLGQIALARFVAPDGLAKLGRNLYGESFDSGQPVVGMAASSGLGRVLSNTLELSNVDLAEEFVKMISAQRGFQANSRVITTTDELMQELVNLKR